LQITVFKKLQFSFLLPLSSRSYQQYIISNSMQHSRPTRWTASNWAHQRQHWSCDS